MPRTSHQSIARSSRRRPAVGRPLAGGQAIRMHRPTLDCDVSPQDFENILLDEPLIAIARDARGRCGEFNEDYWTNLNSTRSYPSDFVASLLEGGCFRLILPKRYDGRALGQQAASTALMELASWGGLSGALPLHTAMLCSVPLLKHARPLVRDDLIPAIAAQEVIPCLAVSDYDVGDNTRRSTAHARRQSRGWTVSGEKKSVTQARHAGLALILASHGPAEHHTRPSLFAARITPRHIKLSDCNGSVHRVVPSCTISFDDLPVPNDHLVGRPNQGLTALAEARNSERIGLSAIMVGIGLAALRQAVHLISGTGPAGHVRSKAAHPLALSRARITAAWATTMLAARIMDRKQTPSLVALEAYVIAAEACYGAVEAALQASASIGPQVCPTLSRYADEARYLRYAIGGDETSLDWIACGRLGLAA